MLEGAGLCITAGSILRGIPGNLQLLGSVLCFGLWTCASSVFAAKPEKAQQKSCATDPEEE